MSRAEDIADGIRTARERIAEAARAAGRPAHSVRLIAVSKKMPIEDLRAAYTVGQRDFGENYAQELRDKRAACAASFADDERQARSTNDPHNGNGNGQAERGSWRWHYIGPLQRNKVKYLAGQVDLIHTVDSREILDEIRRRAAFAGSAASAAQSGSDPDSTFAADDEQKSGRPGQAPLRQECLIQVNVAGEAQKSGVAPTGLAALLDAFALPSASLSRASVQGHDDAGGSPLVAEVTCVGLMLIPPLSGPEADPRRHFAALRELAARERLVSRPFVDLRELSMGMSHDFTDAIAEGATMVRIGTAIFGARPR